MAWFKITGRISTHPAVIASGNEAWGAFCRMGAYCADYATGGVVPVPFARAITSRKVLDRLIENGLVERRQDCYVLVENRELFQIVVGGDVRDEWNAMRRAITPVIFERDEYRCAYCGATEYLTVDHVIPLSRGGTNNLSNLKTCCGHCNSSKGAKSIEEWSPV